MASKKKKSRDLYRIKKLREAERELKNIGYSYIAGVDEVGRGPLAGPVVACACILPDKFSIAKINDSKKLTVEERERIYLKLIYNENVIYSVSEVSHEIIDLINIHQASLLAMKKAIEALKTKHEFLLFDGRSNPVTDTPFQAIVGGDRICISICAASIIAEVHRDKLMDEYHKKYPIYGFNKHKGYGTFKHKKALIENGPCLIHRKSFEPIKSLFN